MIIEVRVQPRASKEEIVKLDKNAFKVYMFEAAIEGKANRKLVEMLADYFGVKKNCVIIKTGVKSRNKIIDIGLKLKA